MIVEPTIYVVDDDTAVRESIVAILESADLFTEDYDSSEGFLDSVQPNIQGCVVLDLSMPNLNGLEVMTRLNARQATLPIVVVTGHADVAMAVRAMKAGAADFIEKPIDAGILLTSVSKTLSGAGKPCRIGPAERSRALAQLTTREREVLEHLVAGHQNKAIAHEMGISRRTVEIHRARVMRKMEARSLSHLIRMAFTAGIGADLD